MYACRRDVFSKGLDVFSNKFDLVTHSYPWVGTYCYLSLCRKHESLKLRRFPRHEKGGKRYKLEYFLEQASSKQEGDRCSKLRPLHHPSCIVPPSYADSIL